MHYLRWHAQHQGGRPISVVVNERSVLGESLLRQVDRRSMGFGGGGGAGGLVLDATVLWHDQVDCGMPDICFRIDDTVMLLSGSALAVFLLYASRQMDPSTFTGLYISGL